MTKVMVDECGTSWFVEVEVMGGVVSGKTKVQPKAGLGVRNGEGSFLHGSLRGERHRQGSRLNSVSTQRTLESRSRRSSSRKFKVHSLELPQPTGTSETSSDPLWRSSGWSSLANSATTDMRQYRLSIPVEPDMRMNVLKENSSQEPEAETNVDTGLTIINSKPRQSFPSRFPRGFQSSQPPSCLSGSSFEVTVSPNQNVFKDRLCPLSLPSQRDIGAKTRISKCSHYLPVQGEEKEEFFI
ncbi:hypothetical protein STEG23_025329 [Scotinomys teguina]